MLGLLGVIVLGAFVPAIPVIGTAGSTFSGFSGLLAVPLAVAVATTAWLVARRRNVIRVVALGVAVLSLLGSVVITRTLMSVASAHGFSVNPFAGGTPPIGPPDVQLPYGEFDGEALDVAIWKPSGAANSPAPVALFIHGGGWIQGNPVKDASGLKATLSEAGWVVVSVEYTLATPTRHTWDVAEGQIACAMAWVGANIDAYGGDPSTFVVTGDSAGGNLAVNSAYRAAAGDVDCPATGALPQVDAVVATYPAVDARALYNDTVAGAAPGRAFAEQYLGGTPHDFPQRYDAVASATHITPAAAPTLILQGENDHLVRPHAVYDFVDEVSAAGVDVTLVRIPFGDHGFDGGALGAQLAQQITLRWLDEKL